MYAQVLAHVEAEQCSLSVAETEILGFQHDALGAEVARRWNFPSTIEQAIRDCHNSDMAALEDLSVVVCFAVQLDQGASPASLCPRVSLTHQTYLGVDASRLTPMLPDEEQLEAVAASLLG